MDNNLKRPFPNEDSFSHSSLDETSWIVKICEEERSADKAVSLIISEIEAEPFYYKCVDQICYDLASIMDRYYKHLCVDIHPFGSAVTNLALKNSDVDVFVDFKDRLPSAPELFIKTLRNKIQKSKKFSKAVAIPARVPIVHSVHLSGISCDFCFLNGLGVLNSNIIKFLTQIDNRIRPLILILKYLLKKKGLSGSISLTSNAVVILIVFFLQQLEEPLLPSISHLQKLCKESRQVAGWETAFITDTTLLPPVTNKSSLPQLLRQFFEFYSTFEFGFYVISSFTGQTYLKPSFNDPESLPDEYSCYKKNVRENSELKFECNKCMCVQGPFNHSHNITRNVTKQILQKFQSFCNESKTICLEDMRKSEGLSSEYFKKLFSSAICDRQNNYKKFMSDENTENVYIHVGTNIDFSDPVCSVEDLLYRWSTNGIKTVTDVLEKVMKCTVEESCLQSNEASFFSSGQVLKMYNCEFHYMDLITKKRNKVRHELKLPQNTSFINQEERISDYLCETLLKNVSKLCLKFAVVCVLERKPTHLCLTLDCKENSKAKKNLMKQVFQFVKTSMPKYFNI